MALQIVFSDETFWKWLSDKIIKDNIKCLDGMVDVDRYVTGQHLRNIQKSRESIFDKLKQAMPSDYYLEMEYCALAYTVIFDKVFPPLAQHVEQLAYIEWLHYVEPEEPNYRDHFVHMLKVAFVCDEIFQKVLANQIVEWQFSSQNIHFYNWCSEEGILFDVKNKRNISQAAAFLAAIFHDFGYGYKFIRDYERRLYKLNLLGCDSVDITKSRGDILKKSLLARFIVDHHEWSGNRGSALRQNQKENIVLGFIHDCLPLNHSVASALAVLDIAEDLYSSHIINADLYVAFQIAAEACCLHDMTKLTQYLHLKNAERSNHFLNSDCYDKIPIAVLLIWADEFSIWNRPRVEHGMGINGAEKIIKFHHRWKDGHLYPEKIELEFSDKQLKISLDNEEQCKIFKDNLIKLSVCRDDIQKDVLKAFDCAVSF